VMCVCEWNKFEVCVLVYTVVFANIAHWVFWDPLECGRLSVAEGTLIVLLRHPPITLGGF
jgi:hypothetical protein